MTIIATGFKSTPDIGFDLEPVKRFNLATDTNLEKSQVKAPLANPMGHIEPKADEPYLKNAETLAPIVPVETAQAPEVQRFNLFEEEPVSSNNHMEESKEREEKFDISNEIELKLESITSNTFDRSKICVV